MHGSYTHGSTGDEPPKGVTLEFGLTYHHRLKKKEKGV